jgi:hypothetical protein
MGLKTKARLTFGDKNIFGFIYFYFIGSVLGESN